MDGIFNSLTNRKLLLTVLRLRYNTIDDQALAELLIKLQKQYSKSLQGWRRGERRLDYEYGIAAGSGHGNAVKPINMAFIKYAVEVIDELAGVESADKALPSFSVGEADSTASRKMEYSTPMKDWKKHAKRVSRFQRDDPLGDSSDIQYDDAEPEVQFYDYSMEGRQQHMNELFSAQFMSMNDGQTVSKEAALDSADAAAMEYMFHPDNYTKYFSNGLEKHQPRLSMHNRFVERNDELIDHSRETRIYSHDMKDLYQQVDKRNMARAMYIDGKK